jgi:hypothetical protein
MFIFKECSKIVRNTDGEYFLYLLLTYSGNELVLEPWSNRYHLSLLEAKSTSTVCFVLFLNSDSGYIKTWYHYSLPQYKNTFNLHPPNYIVSLRWFMLSIGYTTLWRDANNLTAHNNVTEVNFYIFCCV